MRIFITVGNALVPFDRLLGWADEVFSDSPFSLDGVCQHGPSLIRPRFLRPEAQLSRAAFAEEMDAADVVVCHAGVGTLQEALKRGHRPIVVPRRAFLGEIVNDHQLEVARALGERIELVGDAGALREALLRHARGEVKRGAPKEEDPSRLAPIARALERGPARAHPPRAGALVLRALAAIGPSLEKLRVR